MKIFHSFFLLFICVIHQGWCQNIDKGFELLQEGHLEASRKIFLAESRSPNLLTHLFSELGLAKIAIEEKKYELAKSHLDPMKEEDLKSYSDLWHEWLWTQSDLEFRLGNYDQALEFIEKALPKKNHLLATSFGPKSYQMLCKIWQKKSQIAPEEHLKKQGALNALHAYQDLQANYPDFADPRFSAGLYSEYASLAHDSNSYLQASRLFSCPLDSASCLIQEGSAESLEQAEKLLAEERGPFATLLKAECLIQQGDLEQAKRLLLEPLAPPFHEKQLFLLGKIAYENGSSSAAHFVELFETYPTSSLAPDALYWAARCLNNKDYYTRLYQEYKNHPLAPEAYWNCYPPKEYLLGNRAAIKHLHAFKTLFPNSPLLLDALYLEGLDYLHDRRSPEGKWLSRKNLIAAIDAFMEVETEFERLGAHERTQLRNQAKLERAKTNFLMASGAKGSKRSVYLDYAAAIFKEIMENNPSDEAHYFSGLILFHQGKLKEAGAAFQGLISKTGYYPLKSLYQLGIIEKELKNYPQAIQFFDQSLKAPSYLSIDELLDTMIEKSQVLRLSGDLDSAMLQLSSVVDYQAVSSLRLKAMYLRAEIYAEQGRTALARKQLESLSLIGDAKDPWALKAKETLQQEYGFD